MDAWHILRETQPVKLYAKNQMVYRQAETAVRFYFLVSGRAKNFLSSAEGAEKTLSVLEPGSVFGEAAFFDGLPRVSSAKTLEKSEILSVDRAGLALCFAREPQFAMALLTHLSLNIRTLSAQVDGMAFKQADRRVAELLPKLARGAEVRATHEELAALAGTSRVTVSRVLSAFARMGWVETSYAAVLLLRPEELEKFAREGR